MTPTDLRTADSQMAVCDWPQCTDTATHMVTIEFPAEPKELWSVCRLHDRALKIEALASRSKVVPSPDMPPTIETSCGNCGLPLNERADLPSEDRQPCRGCGSLKRLRGVVMTAVSTSHALIRARSKRLGKGGWRNETTTGDEYTRDIEGWSKRETVYDRDLDRFREY